MFLVGTDVRRRNFEKLGGRMHSVHYKDGRCSLRLNDRDSDIVCPIFTLKKVGSLTALGVGICLTRSRCTDLERCWKK